MLASMKALPKRKGNSEILMTGDWVASAASMKALPKRKGNTESVRAGGPEISASMKALPKRKGNKEHREFVMPSGKPQ